MGRRVVVTEIRPETNEVVIGEQEDVFTTTLYANRLNYMSEPDFPEGKEVLAKIRYNHKGSPCVIRREGDDLVRVDFKEPVRAVTPGQAVVFYDGDYVLGGGTIVRTPESFYSEANMRHLDRVIENIESGKVKLTEHELIED